MVNGRNVYVIVRVEENCSNDCSTKENITVLNTNL